MPGCRRQSDMRAVYSKVSRLCLPSKEAWQEACNVVENVPDTTWHVLTWYHRSRTSDSSDARLRQHVVERSPSASAVPGTHGETIDTSTDFWAQSEGLQPSSLLNEQASHGKFSLSNVLSTAHGARLDATKELVAISEDDPIGKGIVSYHIGASLFQGQV